MMNMHGVQIEWMGAQYIQRMEQDNRIKPA